jgi:putative FmdB family regulatory protein
MPLYEYTCRACHADFELLTAASRRDAPETMCPQCGQTKTARKVSLMARPVVKDGGTRARAETFDCGAPGGCCGGACGLDD